MKLPIPSFKTTEVHPVDSVKDAAKSVGNALITAGSAIDDASPSKIRKGLLDGALGAVHLLGSGSIAVGSALKNLGTGDDESK